MYEDRRRDEAMVMYYLIPLVAFGLMGAWYWNYFRKVKAAGGMEAFAEQYNRDAYGLDPGEKVVGFWTGAVYIGPLVPGSMPSKGAQFAAALANLGFRGPEIHFALTDRGRLAIAMEPPDEFDIERVQAMTGTKSHLRPYLLVDRSGGPRLLTPAEAFGNNPDVPDPSKGPKRVDITGQMVPFQLAQLVTPGKAPLTFWGDPTGLSRVAQWTQGG
jgi:hypothetical protein